MNNSKSMLLKFKHIYWHLLVWHWHFTSTLKYNEIPFLENILYITDSNNVIISTTNSELWETSENKFVLFMQTIFKIVNSESKWSVPSHLNKFHEQQINTNVIIIIIICNFQMLYCKSGWPNSKLANLWQFCTVAFLHK